MQRIKLTSILVLALTLTSGVFAQNNSFGKISFKKATNISGKQRMLSQRIAKVFLLQKVGAHTAELTKEYESSLQLFARNLTILKNNSKNASSKIKSCIKNEREQWELFNTRIKSETKKPDTKEVLELSNELLKRAHALVLAIEEESKYNNDYHNNNSNNQLKVETVNTSGKQRMLSQRLCLYYAACRLYKKDKKDSKGMCYEVEKIYNEMNESINSLLINDLNSFPIEENIGKILSLFQVIENDRRDFFNNKIPLSKIMNTTNNITNLYNIVTGQYSSL